MLGQEWIDDFAPQGLDGIERAILVTLDEAGITDDVRCDYCCQPPFDLDYPMVALPGGAPDALPGSADACNGATQLVRHSTPLPSGLRPNSRACPAHAKLGRLAVAYQTWYPAAGQLCTGATLSIAGLHSAALAGTMRRQTSTSPEDWDRVTSEE
jgi:hypothetical protein